MVFPALGEVSDPELSQFLQNAVLCFRYIHEFHTCIAKVATFSHNLSVARCLSRHERKNPYKKDLMVLIDYR